MKKHIFASLISVLAVYSIPALSASIDMVNGNLITGSTNTSISPGSTGLFSSEDSSYAEVVLDASGTIGTRQVAYALTTADITSSGFNITALSEGGFYFNSSYQEGWANLTVQGSLVFNVTENGFFDYSWNNGILNPYDLSDTRLILKNASGFEILNCSSFLLCLNPASTDIQSVNGSLSLSQGQYELSYTANVARAAGTSIFADMEFSLNTAPVPLPAALWLFVSGLTGLLAHAMRKRSGNRGYFFQILEKLRI